MFLALMISFSWGYVQAKGPSPAPAKPSDKVEAKQAQQKKFIGEKTLFFATATPGFLRIDGTGGPASGTVEIKDSTANANFELDLNTLKSGISLRDTHMKEKYLKTGEFPKASLAISSMDIAEVLKTDVKDKKFEGKLTLHGQEKPIQGTYATSRSGEDIKISAKFEIDILDFGIEIPSYAGVKVAKSVRVEIEGLVK